MLLLLLLLLGANVIVAGSAVFLKKVDGVSVPTSEDERKDVITGLRSSIVNAGYATI